MAAFPSRENDVVVLAEKMIKGFTDNAETFPSPPVTVEELQAAYDEFKQSRDAAVDAAAAANSAYDTKGDSLENMIDKMKANLKYAESAAGQDEGKLNLVGWGLPKPRTVLSTPGQVRYVEVVRSGKGWIYLDWKAPTDGGAVAAYKVQRARPEEGLWENVGTAVETEILLSKQERGVDLEYRVIAMNRAGEGAPSNAVRVIL
jgi:hypothetical protein